MLICEVIAFLSRIANSNMCHFAKRTAMAAEDTISRGLFNPSDSVRLQQWLPSVTCYF